MKSIVELLSMQHCHQCADKSLILFVILLQIIFWSLSDLKSWLKKIILQFFRFLSWFYVKHFHDFLNNFTTIIVMNFTWKFTIAMIVVKVLRGKMQCIWCIEDEYAKWFVPRWHCHLIRLECSKWTYFLAFSQYHPGFSRYRWSSNGSCCGSNSMNSYRGFKF